MQAKQSRYKEWRVERLKKGLCLRCENVSGEGVQHCDQCSDLRKAEGKAIRSQRKVKGLCVLGCGRFPEMGKVRCSECILRGSEWQKKEYRRLKAEIVEGYGGRCECCGESAIDFLTLDHKYNDGHRERRENNYNLLRLYRRVIRDGFPERYRVQCYNCNCGRARNGGICPHLGTGQQTDK